jgi:alkylhydroperoxidase family enzyme
MNDRFASLRAATSDALLRQEGATARELRQAVAEGRPPRNLLALVEKIRSRPWTVTDHDVDELRDQYTEDQLFEIIVAAAFGAAEERLQAAHRALDEA